MAGTCAVSSCTVQNMTNGNHRLVRWSLALQKYTFTVQHRPGKSHLNADGLSRQCYTDEEVENDSSIFRGERGRCQGKPLTSWQPDKEL